MGRRGSASLERILLLVLLSVATWSIVRYVDYRRRMPRPAQIGDLVITEADREAARRTLEEAFSQPVILLYREQVVELDPETVGFRVSAEQMLAPVWDEPSLQFDVADFLSVTLGGDSRPLVLSLVADFDSEALQRELHRVAEQHDRPHEPLSLIASSLRLARGGPFQRLDIEASLPRVVDALASPTNRQVDLVVTVEETDSSRPGLEELRPVLDRVTAEFPGLVALVTEDLSSGEEMSMNGEVAFAGMSLLKVAIVEEFFRQLDSQPTPEETRLITETLTLIGDSAPNRLLMSIGESDPYRGAERLTESMRYVGLVNTFMASPYSGHNESPPGIMTPANSRPEIDTEPDPYIQTTPRDVALLLEMIYQGAAGGGTLIAAFPGEITPEECAAILEVMKSNRLGSMLEVSVPEGIPVAHKYGWISDTHADAGIVFSPGGDYVLVVFVYHQGQLDWEGSSSLIADIGHVVYNCFNMDDQW